MQSLKEVMIGSLMLLLLINSFCPATHAAPQAGAGAAAGAAGAAGSATTASTTTTTQTSAGSAGAVGGAAAGAGALNGVQGIVGGALNMASMPLNTITASLNQLGIPTIATAPLSAVSSLFAQAGSVYGR